MDAPEIGRIKLLDRLHHLDSGVVHQNVGVEGELFQSGRVQQIHCPGLPFDVLGNDTGTLGVAVRHHHVRTLRGEFPGAGRPDSARTAGNDRPPARERAGVETRVRRRRLFGGAEAAVVVSVCRRHC